MEHDLAILEKIELKRRTWAYHNVGWLLPASAVCSAASYSQGERFFAGAVFVGVLYLFYVAIDSWEMRKKERWIVTYWGRQGEDILLVSLKRAASASHRSP